LNDLSEILRAEIAAYGPLSFARFMGLALYHPDFGYYERPRRRVGRKGDFITSVAVGGLFGELLAAQFARWLDELHAANSKRQTPILLESGAHDGRLAADILAAWTAQPTRQPVIRYLLLEPSERRRAGQRETLAAHLDQVEWRESWTGLAGQPVHGVLFANELLDALPVHRLGWSAVESRWFEWRVDCDRERFVWRRGSAPVSPELTNLLPASLQAAGRAGVLPDGYSTEVSPGALDWWRAAASHLSCGWLVTFDYGLRDEEYANPARLKGTLRAYSEHHVAADVLAAPGEHDLTAHVNFTALQRAGEEAGLETVGCWTQEQFLGGIVQRLAPDKLAAWDAVKRRQFQALTHPEQLGRKFRVLAQRRAAAT